MRKTPVGSFVTPVSRVGGIADGTEGFFPSLPPVPFALLSQIIRFFRDLMKDGHETEALVLVYWDWERKTYFLVVPPQAAGKAQVYAELDIDLLPDPGRYVKVMDIHSHNSMAAEFSEIDDRDELETGVYVVMGRLNRFFPQMNARISNNGQFLQIPLSKIFGGISMDYPRQWTDAVRRTA